MSIRALIPNDDPGSNPRGGGGIFKIFFFKLMNDHSDCLIELARSSTKHNIASKGK